MAVPGMELVNALIGCGTSSGRDVNKVEKFNIAMRKVEGTKIEAPESSRLLIHATVCQTVDADDHVLHVCDVKMFSPMKMLRQLLPGTVMRNLRKHRKNNTYGKDGQSYDYGCPLW